MNNLSSYVLDINKCLNEIIDIFKLPEITLNFELLDQNGVLDNHNLSDYVEHPVTSMVVYRYQSYGSLPSPTRQYYDFKGWFLYFERDESTGSKPRLVWENEIEDYSKVLLPGNIVKLYAKWELKTIDIKLDPCGGSVYPLEVKCKLYENLYNAIINVQGPIKANANFTFWNDNKNEIIDEYTLLSVGIDTLYANYDEGKYTLTFNYNYTGDVSKSTDSKIPNTLPNIQNGDSINLVSYNGINLIEQGKDTLSRPGFRFKGWSLLKNNPDTQFVVYIYENTTLYASWEPLSYNIEYKYDNVDELTPLSCQTAEFNTVVTLIPYKTLFYKDPPEDFLWNHTNTNHFSENSDKFTDSDLVENLLSTDNATVTFYPPKINSNNLAIHEFIDGVVNTDFAISAISLKEYIPYEKFYGLDFIMKFNGGIMRHPSKISPSVYIPSSDNIFKVTCEYGVPECSAVVNIKQSLSNYLSTVEFPENLSDYIKTNYEYGNRLDLDSFYVIEKFSTGQTTKVNYSDFPERFFSYPDKSTFLTGNTTFYLGYTSSDDRVWPHVQGNDAMWDNTEQSITCSVNNGEESIIITNKPNKRVYIEGEKLNLSGLTLFIKMTTGDMKSFPLSAYDFTPNINTNLQPTMTEVVIKYYTAEDESTYLSTSFDITVNPKKLTSFTITANNDALSTLIFTHSVPFDTVADSIKRSTVISGNITYDNNNREVRTFSSISNYIVINEPAGFDEMYGEIPLTITYNYNGKSSTDSLTIKKRYEYTLIEFSIDTGNRNISELNIANIKNTITAPFAIECFNANGGIIDVILATKQSNNYYAFDKDARIKANVSKCRITSTTNDNSGLLFDYNMTNSDINYVNKYISNIKKCIPSFTFTNSIHDSITIYYANNGGVWNPTSISPSAFFKDESILRLTLPSAITNIGVDAFSGCSNLSSITFKQTIPPSMDKSTFGRNSTTYTGINTNNRYFNVLSGTTSVSTINDSITAPAGQILSVTLDISSVYKNNDVIADCLNRPSYPFKLSTYTLPN